MTFKNMRVPCTTGFYGNMLTLTNNFVTSVFVKVYRRVELKVEVKVFFLDAARESRARLNRWGMTSSLLSLSSIVRL